MKRVYQLRTALSVDECRKALLHALDHQATVQMAPGWIHAPHVVEGWIGDSEIKIHHVGTSDAPAFLHAWIKPCDGGSEIVGVFTQGRLHGCLMSLARWFVTLLLIGMPAFVVFGVLRDERAVFSPELVVFVTILVLAGILLQPFLRRLAEVSEDDTRVVRNFIERAISPDHPQVRSVE